MILYYLHPSAIELSTLTVLVEWGIPFVVTGQTPLQPTAEIPGGFPLAVASPAPEKPSYNPGFCGILRPAVQLCMEMCCSGCRFMGEISHFRYTHRPCCLRSDFKPLKFGVNHSPKHTSQSKIRMKPCGYCKSVRHMRHIDFQGFLNNNQVQSWAAGQHPPPPPPPNPLPKRMDGDMPEQDSISGYDSPRRGLSGHSSGSGGNLTPCGGNAEGHSDVDDSDSWFNGHSVSSLADSSSFLRRPKSYWNNANKIRYNKWYYELVGGFQKWDRGEG